MLLKPEFSKLRLFFAPYQVKNILKLAINKTDAKTRRRVSELKYLLPKVGPIIPPITAAAIQNQTFAGRMPICA